MILFSHVLVGDAAVFVEQDAEIFCNKGLGTRYASWLESGMPAYRPGPGPIDTDSSEIFTTLWTVGAVSTANVLTEALAACMGSSQVRVHGATQERSPLATKRLLISAEYRHKGWRRRGLCSGDGMCAA